MKKSNIFCLVGFILGAVAFVVSVTGVVFSVLGYFMCKKQAIAKIKIRPKKINFF